MRSPDDEVPCLLHWNQLPVPVLMHVGGGREWKGEGLRSGQWASGPPVVARTFPEEPSQGPPHQVSGCQAILSEETMTATLSWARGGVPLPPGLGGAYGGIGGFRPPAFLGSGGPPFGIFLGGVRPGQQQPRRDGGPFYM